MSPAIEKKKKKNLKKLEIKKVSGIKFDTQVINTELKTAERFSDFFQRESDILFGEKGRKFPRNINYDLSNHIQLGLIKSSSISRLVS